MRRSLTLEATKFLVYTWTCNFVSGQWNVVHNGLPSSTLLQLQRVQNTAARIIPRTWRRYHINPALIKLHW